MLHHQLPLPLSLPQAHPPLPPWHLLLTSSGGTAKSGFGHVAGGPPSKWLRGGEGLRLRCEKNGVAVVVQVVQSGGAAKTRLAGLAQLLQTRGRLRQTRRPIPQRQYL